MIHLRPLDESSSQAGGQRWARAAFGFFSAVLLFLSFETNFLQVVKPEAIEDFQQDSESLVVNRLALVQDEGAFTRHGLLIYQESELLTEYLSCFGLQGLVLGILQAGSGLSALAAVEVAHHVFVALFSLTLGLFLVALFDEFAAATAVVVLLLLAASKWLILFARNLYWAIFLHFLPFCLAWRFYPRVVGGGLSFQRFAALIGAAVFIKSLCSYEYITNIIMAASVPVCYFELKMGSDWTKIFKRIFAVSAAGCIGFFFALTIHLTQLTIHLGSVEAGVAPIMNRVLARTYGPAELTLMPPDATIVDAVRGYFSHLVLRLGIPLQIKHLLGVFLALPVLGLLARRSAKWTHLRGEAGRLYLTCGFALAATLTWVFMAKGHMYYHRHINSIVYQLPFLTTLYVLLGWTLAASVRTFTGWARDGRPDENSTGAAARRPANRGKEGDSPEGRRRGRLQ